MSKPKKNARKQALPLDPLEGYEPCGTRGPSTTLTQKMIMVIARELASGMTRKAACATAGTTDACLRRWLAQGEGHLQAGKTTLYTKLLAEVLRAEAHYAKKLTEIEHLGMVDPKGYDLKHVRWRKALLDPEHCTVPRAGPPDAGGVSGFKLMTFEEAEKSVEAKIRRFLAAEASRLTPPAPAPSEPSPAAETPASAEAAPRG